MAELGTGGPAPLAIVLSGLGLGGVQRTMLTLADGIAARGIPVDLVVPDGHGPFREQVPPSVRLVELDAGMARLPWFRARKRRRSLASTLALARYLERVRPRAAFSASHYVNLSLLAARRLSRHELPVVVSQRTHLSRAVRNAGFPFRRRPLLGRMVRMAYPSADAIVAVSAGVADDLAEVAGLARERIEVVPNPLRLEQVREGAAQPPPHPWLAPDEPPVCLAVGRLAAQKDFPTLLRAFARVRQNRMARLLVLGEGRERGALESCIRELGLSEDVELPGYVENPFAWMSRARLFVLSSAYEGLPGVVIQALACGCPVVSTDCPSGPREILQGGKLGALVPVGDSDALAAAIDGALNGRVDRTVLVRRAEDFALEPIVDRWLGLLDRDRRT
ncbi:MAG: glycosyltransferase [Deltaproteobacteria bacterium]|nr:glycosyltransferase [Deltaproteobacteria bacterium]MBW2396127.1 glycosyltransferase [Deltaproteobacteria bacterium]